MGNVLIHITPSRFLFRVLRFTGTLTVLAALLLGARFLQQRLTDSSSILVNAVAIQSAIPGHQEPVIETNDAFVLAHK